MSSSTTSTEINRLSVLQQRLSHATWFIVLLLSIRGLYTFYGMQEKGSIEQTINFVTEPIVQLFNFKFLGSLSDIPGITICFAAISLLLASYILQISIKYTQFRFTRARSYALQRALPVK